MNPVLVPEPALPFAPALDLRQYASLACELALHPAQTPAVLARYGLASDDARRRLEAHWSARFAAEPAVRAEFERLYYAYAAWLQGRR